MCLRRNLAASCTFLVSSFLLIPPTHFSTTPSSDTYPALDMLAVSNKYDSTSSSIVSLFFSSNSFSVVNEMESYLLDVINNTSNSGYISEDGVIEKWVGGINKKEWNQKIKEAAKLRREHLSKELDDKKGS